MTKLEMRRPQQTAAEDRIPKLEKVVYGLGSPVLGFVDQIISYQVQQVLVYGMGLSPALNSIMLMIYRIVDGHHRSDCRLALG